MSPTKIKLGDRPKSFKKTVEFKLLDGGIGVIECLYKYRTRKEWGAFVDELVASAKPAPADATTADDVAAPQLLPDSASATLGIEALMQKACAANVRYLLQVLDGWDLDGPLNAENLEFVADMYPGAVSAIMETYAGACRDGRLGN